MLVLARSEGRAGESLRAVGATHDALTEELRATVSTWKDRQPTFGADVRSSPRFAAVLARAEGLALARNAEPAQDDVLVSLLWEPDSVATLLLREHGGRTAVARAFAERGGELPGELPAAEAASDA